MLKLDTILYPTDFSRCAEQALTHALFLAEQFAARLQLLHAVVLHGDDPGHSDHRFPEPKELLERLYEIAGSEMRELTARGEDSAVAIQEFTRRGFAPAQVILDHVREHDVDLVVMGTHGRRGPARLFFGSVAEEVVRFAPCPVLTLRELEEPRPIAAIGKILVPVDFSRHSERALAHARELAAAYGAALQLVHVVEQPTYPYFYTTFAGLEAAGEVEALQTRSHEALEKLLRKVPGPETEVEIEVLLGRAASEIADYAERSGSDLLVIATHGLSGLERLLVGSTAEQVVRTVATPVFLVKSFGKSLLES